MQVSKRILIIGSGSIAKKHIQILKKYWPSFEIAIYKKGNISISEELNLYSKKFSSYEECLNWGPNYVIIASPCSFHIDQAIFFSRRGIPTIIEKRIGEGSEPKSTRENLLSISKSVPVMVGYVFRHDDCLRKLEKLLISKEFGQIIEVESYCGSWLPDWRPDSNYKKTVSAQKKLVVVFY